MSILIKLNYHKQLYPKLHSYTKDILKQILQLKIIPLHSDTTQQKPDSESAVLDSTNNTEALSKCLDKPGPSAHAAIPWTLMWESADMPNRRAQLTPACSQYSHGYNVL